MVVRIRLQGPLKLRQIIRGRYMSFPSNEGGYDFGWEWS